MQPDKHWNSESETGVIIYAPGEEINNSKLENTIVSILQTSLSVKKSMELTAQV